MIPISRSHGYVLLCRGEDEEAGASEARLESTGEVTEAGSSGGGARGAGGGSARGEAEGRRAA